jgi:hypothetical protein
MTKRIGVLLLCLFGAWLLKKIWQKVISSDAVTSFVDKYLCDNKITGYHTMQQVDRNRFFVFLNNSKGGA